MTIVAIPRTFASQQWPVGILEPIPDYLAVEIRGSMTEYAIRDRRLAGILRGPLQRAQSFAEPCNPFMPFLGEESTKTLSVLLNGYILKQCTSWHGRNLFVLGEQEIGAGDEDAQQISSAVASARQSKKLKLRQPVSKVLVVTEKPLVKQVSRNLRTLLLRQANSKGIQLVGLREEERLKKLLVEPNYRGLGPVFRQDAGRVAEAVRQLDGRELYKALASDRYYVLKLNGNEYKITNDMVSFREEMPDNYAAGTLMKEGSTWI